MAAELPRPGVEVVQEFVSASPTIVTPTLVPCIVAPFFEILEVFNADNTTNEDARIGSLYQQNAMTLPQLSLPAPRGNIDEIDIDETSIRVWTLFGGSLTELSRTSSFLSTINIATQPFCEGSATGPFNVDGLTLIINLDSHTSIGTGLPNAAAVPAASNVTITLSGATATIADVVNQINAIVPGLASDSSANPGQLRLTSTNYGAGASVIVRAAGSANTALGFSAVTDQAAVGAGFYSLDDGDGDLLSPRLEIFAGTTQRDITAANVDAITPPSFSALDIQSGDTVVADGVNIGAVDQVFASRLNMQVEQTIFSQTSRFAPRYVWVQANNLSFPVPIASNAGTLLGTVAATAATRAYVVGQAAGTYPVAAAESMVVDVTLGGVAQPTENITSGTGWANLAAAIAGINSQATNFEAYPANAFGDEVASAVATNIGLRTMSANTGSSSAITLQSQTVGMTLGFSSLPIADVGENVRYQPGTRAQVLAGSAWSALGGATSGNTVIYTPTVNGAAQAAETVTWTGSHAADATGLAAAIADWNGQALFTEAYESNATGVETASGGYFAIRTLGENVGTNAIIDVSGGTDVTLVGGAATTPGTDTDLNGLTFQWSLDGNPRVYEVTFAADEDDGGTSQQQVLDLINAETPGVAVSDPVALRQMRLTSGLVGEASAVSIGSGTGTTILGFTASASDAGNGRPQPDLVVDSQGQVLVQANILRDGQTGIPFPVANAGLYLSYTALRLDVTPRANNAALLRFADTTALLAAADPISTANPGAAMSFLTLLNSPGLSVTAIGVPEISADAPEGTPVGYAECLSFLESEEVYALALGTQDSIVQGAARTHVDFMSQSEQKGERILFQNMVTPSRAQSTLLGSGVDANTTATPGQVLVDTNIAQALINQGIDPAAVNPASGAIANEVYLDLAGDDNYYLIQSVANGTTVTLRTTFATGEDADSFYATANPSGVVSDDWTVQVRGAQLLQPGTTTPDKDRIAETVQAQNLAIQNRRVFSTFPDQVGINITGLEQLVDGYYADACIVGMVASQPPQQGFTNFPVTGLTQVVGSHDTYSKSQLNVMAAGGTYILMQDAVGAPVISRHQLSTDVTSIEKRELSITKVVDFTAKFIRAGLRNFIGRVNITQAFIDQLSTIVEGLMSFLVDTGVLIGYAVNNILQDANSPDTILVDITIDVPYPANYIRVTLVI